MASVRVDVAGTPYALACAAGDEAKLTELARYVDEKASALKSKLGHVAENRLLLMTALVIADELNDMAAGKGTKLLASFTEQDLAAILDQVAVEVEEVAERVSAP